MYAFLDIGGTKTRVAVSHDGETLATVETLETPQNFSEGVERIAQTLRSLVGNEVPEKLVCGVAGALRKEKDALARASHLPAWNGAPLREELMSRTGITQVFLENDTALVGLGEAHFGAGQGSEILAYLTVSTGVGGVRIVDGAIDKSTYGFEPGHQILDVDTSYLVGGAWTAEDILSGTALERRMGVKAYEVRDPYVWEELARILAIMVHNTILHWSPDTVVLGGSMITGNPSISLEKVQEHLAKIPSPFPELPALRKAELKDRGGVYGGLAYIQTI
jgi:glucokinase